MYKTATAKYNVKDLWIKRFWSLKQKAILDIDIWTRTIFQHWFHRAVSLQNSSEINEQGSLLFSANIIHYKQYPVID